MAGKFEGKLVGKLVPMTEKSSATARIECDAARLCLQSLLVFGSCCQRSLMRTVIIFAAASYDGLIGWPLSRTVPGCTAVPNSALITG